MNAGRGGPAGADGEDDANGAEVARGARPSEPARVEAFSDGVLAIVITLLVLDLHAGPFRPGAMLDHLFQQWPAYVAYFASFGYVGVIWVNHHQLFTRIAWVDLGLLWRNLALLLVTSVLPFPTAVVSSAFQGKNHRDEVTALVFYALLAAVMATTWLLLFHYLATNERLLARHTPPSFFAQERQRALLGIVAYLLAAVLALWLPLGSLLIIAVLPVFYGLTSEGWHWPRDRSRAARWP
jgi:TMEM175 potassium channel family protein